MLKGIAPVSCAHATMDAPASTSVRVRVGRGDGDLDDMKASLWGELQRSIDLSLIYAKLPLAPFFRLRQVCKKWNRLASDREFLEHNFKPPISNLYFVVEGRLLTFQDSGSWTSSPLPFHGRCAESGLLYDDRHEHPRRVFDVHTRVFYSVPPPPESVLDEANEGDEQDGLSVHVVAMAVDTSRVPYGFRLFHVDRISTRIYDSSSGAWTLVSAKHNALCDSDCVLSSVHYQNYLNVLVESGRSTVSLFTYDVKSTLWEGWEGGEVDMPEAESWESVGIGVWQDQDRWFVVGTKWITTHTVWEMNAQFEEPSTWFDWMPFELWAWLLGGGLCEVQFSGGEHVLLHTGLERAVLYNLNRKTWEKIELVGNTDVEEEDL